MNPETGSPGIERPRVVVGSRNAAKLSAVQDAFTLSFGDVSVEGIDVDGTKDQPTTDQETLEGAEFRARAARAARADATFWVGIEGGVEEVAGRLMVNAWVVISDATGTGRSRSATFELPESVATTVHSGATLGGVTSRVVDQGDWRELGILSHLSNGLMTRGSFYMQPVTLALLRFLPPAAEAPAELRYEKGRHA
ncbi:hypothetical protein GCM10010400_61440 [Streptomyces aculeolatus]|uniref:DUF84 family protein n=1 Tax=Streptomyces aculeolatus TaxID=270689 RepID=UPI000565A2F9|nr:inosine/xanthosine triphosphatase [Streptomyces aculeolatus]